MEVLIRILSLLGVIALSVFCFWLMMKIPIKKRKDKHPWQLEDWYLGGKPKKINQRIRD